MGSKALYESILQLPGASAARNYLPIEKARKGSGTLLFVGEEPYFCEAWREERLKEFEALARTGARVVFAMRPLPGLPEPKPRVGKESQEPPPILKRWGIGFGY